MLRVRVFWLPTETFPKLKLELLGDRVPEVVTGGVVVVILATLQPPRETMTALTAALRINFVLMVSSRDFRWPMREDPACRLREQLVLVVPIVPGLMLGHNVTEGAWSVANRTIRDND
jgi:hypothetical protein